MVAWYRRFPAKNNPGWKKKDQEVDDGMGAGAAPDHTVDGGGEGLEVSDEEATDSEVPPGRAAV